jgi:NAD(P)-dependent dehydrogenase (short-subunit alcohol dehydrogenase family)
MNNIFSLEGKIVVVTGAAGLIGSAQCKALSDFGATVVVCDIDLDKAEKIADNLNEHSFAVVLDVRIEDSIKRARNVIIFKSDLDVLEQSMFENYSIELWNKSLEVNLTGTVLCCKIFGSQMAENKKGSIINVASTYGIVGPDQSIYTDEKGSQKFYKSPSYPSAKGAIINFTRYLAAYWGKKGVRVNTLSPGGVENNQDEFFIKNYTRRTMLGRMAKPDDYSGALIFLASDASAYMTGANVVVDGGWTAW